MDKAPVSAVGIVGVSGYWGSSWRARRGASAALALAISDYGRGRRSPTTRPCHGAVQVRRRRRATAAAFAGLDVVSSCTPAECCRARADHPLGVGARVSTVGRLSPREYPRWYLHARAARSAANGLPRPEAGASGASGARLRRTGCRHGQHVPGAGPARGEIIGTEGIIIDAAPARPAPKASEDFRSRRWTATSAPIARCFTSTRPDRARPGSPASRRSR